MQSLELNGISKQFGSIKVLSSISLSIEAGERVAIVGESGSGKTTLLRIIAGLETPTAGRVRLHEQEATNWPPNKRGIGVVFQDYATYPRLTVAENLSVTMAGGLTRAEKEARLEEVAQWLGLKDLLKRLPTELSGGQVQRVALGKALMARPKVLLLDEPFSQLDVRLAEQMRGWLAECHRRYGLTQIMVTHDPLDALTSVDKLAVLHRGQLSQFATPDEIRRQPRSLFAAELTSPCGLNIFPPNSLGLADRAKEADRAQEVAEVPLKIDSLDESATVSSPMRAGAPDESTSSGTVSTSNSMGACASEHDELLRSLGLDGGTVDERASVKATDDDAIAGTASVSKPLGKCLSEHDELLRSLGLDGGKVDEPAAVEGPRESAILGSSSVSVPLGNCLPEDDKLLRSLGLENRATIENRATMAVRPEAVRLWSSDSDADCVIVHCQMVAMRDLGIVRLAQLIHGQNQVSMLWPANVPPPREGEEVVCAINRADLMAFDD